MNALVKAEFEIPEAYAHHLREIACTREVSESALIAEALEMLFYDFEIEQAEKADLEYLRELEAELGPLPPLKPAKSISPDDVAFVISDPPPGKVVRRIRWKRDDS
jgi:hypothetical protein